MEGWGGRVVWWSRNVGGWEVEITGLLTCVIEMKRHRSGFEAPAGGVGGGGVQRRAYELSSDQGTQRSGTFGHARRRMHAAVTQPPSLRRSRLE